jgi:hypothetical protein
MKKIGSISFIILVLLSYFIEGLRNEPSISILMMFSLVISSLGFYFERRKDVKKNKNL